MVCEFGMSSSIGPVAYQNNDHRGRRTGDSGSGEWSEDVTEKIEAEVQPASRAFDSAVQTLTRRRAVLDGIARLYRAGKSGARGVPRAPRRRRLVLVFGFRAGGLRSYLRSAATAAHVHPGRTVALRNIFIPPVTRPGSRLARRYRAECCRPTADAASLGPPGLLIPSTSPGCSFLSRSCRSRVSPFAGSSAGVRGSGKARPRK